MNPEKSTHRHPLWPHPTIEGYRLEPGDTLQKDDMYNSTARKWEECPCPGLILQEGPSAYWVRPAKQNTPSS